MKSFNVLTFILSLITFVLAQQLTTTNPAGVSVVELITTNALGQTITQVLQTVGGAAAPTTTTTTASQAASTAASTAATTASTTSPTTAATVATATTQQQGPVGQPGTTPLTPGGPTPYTYTTTDANGNPVIETATFTPTFPTTVSYTPTGSGTILPYSVWLSQVGTHTGALNQPAASQAANFASRAGVKHGVLLGGVSIAIMCVI